MNDEPMDAPKGESLSKGGAAARATTFFRVEAC